MNNVKTVKDAVLAPRLSTKQSRYVTEHSVCAICESPLELRHHVNKKTLKVKEEASCPKCGVRVRSRFHSMH